MTTRMTRKEFCGSILGGTVLLFIQGCGGGGSNYTAAPASPPPPSVGNVSTACSDTIANNHGHVLTIALADLDSATDKTYDIQGSADHTHSVTLTVAQLATLKSGGSVSSTSTTSFAHQHEITVTCM